MLKSDMKRMALECLKVADESSTCAVDCWVEQDTEEANYQLNKSIANSLLSIAYLIGMKEDLALFGEFLKERRKL